MNLEVLESTGFLECDQVNDDLQVGTTLFALSVGLPELLGNRVPEGSDDGSSVPVVVVEEPREGARAFRGSLGVVLGTLGHARISITMDIYRHVLEGERREAALDLFDAVSPERNLRPIAVA